MTLTPYKNILVPTDGSDYSLYAAEHAVYLAKALGAKLYALNVVNAPLAFHAGIHYAESKVEMEHSGKKAVTIIKALCDEKGVECQEMIVEGDPRATIVDVARKVNADCIVIGSIGMSALERVLIGSVSDSVLRHAPCPVLMIRKS
ncbi:MAG TPA: universal stress protein [Methanocella sp.]|uniref:universal stress protein n=1 Tax=Methanocella sp. TaxID=2052833 RepID=UPI002CCC7FA4|nr:universal stress protein [Methanocella sp.]HTY92163.1 universal stress protein [Methanocella sp.]